jgi:nicotinamide phosphoribosyltransferase
MAGFSIPASEHSTITSWLKEHEVDACRNMLEQYPEGLVACVSDSYDIFNCCANIWGGALKEQIPGTQWHFSGSS